MQTPEELASFTARQGGPYEEAAAGPLHHSRIDPDDPPWGVLMAILVWLSSLLLLGILPVVFVLPYAAYRGITPAMPDYPRAITELVLKDPTTIFLQVFSTLPAHLLTVLLVWAVVTRFGRQPFWETVGWNWGRWGRFGLWISIGLGVVLYAASSVVAQLLGGDKATPLDLILNSSTLTRYAIAFLATITAPFVEEFVFRGVLYSALQRAIGKVVAVIFVALLFTAVHILQYRTNYGVIAAVGLLSLGLTLVRAVSGRLLPCYIMHLVFNGIQSVIIVLKPPSAQPVIDPDHAGALIQTLARSIHLPF